MGIDDERDDDTVIEGSNPFDELTQPIESDDEESSSESQTPASSPATPASVSSSQEPPASLDETVTWARAAGPPVIVEPSEEVAPVVPDEPFESTPPVVPDEPFESTPPVVPDEPFESTPPLEPRTPVAAGEVPALQVAAPAAVDSDPDTDEVPITEKLIVPDPDPDPALFAPSGPSPEPASPGPFPSFPSSAPAPPAPLSEPDAAETLLAESTETIAKPQGERLTTQRLAPSSSLRPLLLERIEPSLGRGERLRLDASNWQVSLGRGEQNDVRLYTAAASREHAHISGNADAEWVLTPVEGKVVLIDGDPTSEPVVLETGMNVILGHDHLRCVTEGLRRHEMAAPTQADGFDDAMEEWKKSGGSTALLIWGLGLAAALAGGVALYSWLGG